MLMNELERFRALIVSGCAAERAETCTELEGAGYDALAFLDCAGALSWLEEETPDVAVLSSSEAPVCAELVCELQARCVDLVVDGQPLDGTGAVDLRFRGPRF